MLFEGWIFFTRNQSPTEAYLVRQVRQHPEELYWRLMLIERMAMQSEKRPKSKKLLLTSLVKLIEADPGLIFQRGLPSDILHRWSWAEAQYVLAAVPNGEHRDLLEAHFLAAIADRCMNRKAALTAARRAIDRVPGPQRRADAWAALVGDILVRQDTEAFKRRFPELMTALNTGPFIGQTLATWLIHGELTGAAEAEVRSALAKVPSQNRDVHAEATLLEKDGLAALKRGDSAAVHRHLEAMTELAGTGRFFPTKLVKRLITERVELELCANYLERAATTEPLPLVTRAFRRLAATARARA